MTKYPPGWGKDLGSVRAFMGTVATSHVTKVLTIPWCSLPFVNVLTSGGVVILFVCICDLGERELVWPWGVFLCVLSAVGSVRCWVFVYVLLFTRFVLYLLRI